MVNFADDLVVDDPLIFCDFIEWRFFANVFGFGSHYLVWFHQVCWYELRRGYLSPCLVSFGFSTFGCLGRAGDQIYCAHMLLVSPTLVG